jgi:hypothetical protein
MARRGEPLPINQALNRPRAKLGLDLTAWMAITFVCVTVFLVGFRLLAMMAFPSLAIGAWLRSDLFWRSRPNLHWLTVSVLKMRIRWEHTHQCRGCGHAIRINDLDPKAITTGVVTCPKCEMSGPINVKILQLKDS